MIPLLPPLLQAEVDNSNVSPEKTSIPAFTSLYRHLTTQVLDIDASARSKNQEREDTSVAKRLRERHIESARDAILLRALCEVALLDPKVSTLPASLRRLTYLISTYLASLQTGAVSVGSEATDLMADELEDFQQNLPVITHALSKHLTALEDTMVKMMEPLVFSSTDSTLSQQPLPPPIGITSRNPNPRTKTIKTPTLPSSSALAATHIQTQTHLTTVTLPTTLKQLTSTLHALQTLHTTLLTTQIRHAELHTHSALSRHASSHAMFLGAVAQGLSLKSQILVLQREKEAYAQRGVVEGLKDRFELLNREERGLVERERRLREVLRDYEGKG